LAQVELVALTRVKEAFDVSNSHARIRHGFVEGSHELRFGEDRKLREAFTNADRGVAGTYLRQLVDRIVVGKEEIVVEAKAAEVIAMMADSGLMGAAGLSRADKRLDPESAGDVVHTDVHGWRAPPDSNGRPADSKGEGKSRGRRILTPSVIPI
jgi:hypothetical protein